MLATDVARVAHEANRALQIVAGDPAVSPAWDEAPAWQRESAVHGVQKARMGMGPAALHEEWCAYKRAEGWVFGPVKDPEAKTHPCLVAYDDLPAEQQAKDHLFAAIVTVLSDPPPATTYGIAAQTPA